MREGVRRKLVSTFEGKNENHFANFLAAVRSRKREDQTAEILEGLLHLLTVSDALAPTAMTAHSLSA